MFDIGLRRSLCLLIFVLAVCNARWTALAAGRTQVPSALPSYFEENHGQAPGDVKYLSKGLGYKLLLREDGPTLQFGASSLKVRLLGSNLHPRIIGESLLEGKTNYLIGNDATKWKTNIPQFADVRYESAYHGIDVLYHGDRTELEYDFIVKPRVDPGRIVVGFEGASQVRIDRNGELIVKVGGQEIRQQRPIAYQETTRGHQAVNVRYVLLQPNGRKVSWPCGPPPRMKG